MIYIIAAANVEFRAMGRCLAVLATHPYVYLNSLNQKYQHITGFVRDNIF